MGKSTGNLVIISRTEGGERSAKTPGGKGKERGTIFNDRRGIGCCMTKKGCDPNGELVERRINGELPCRKLG